MMKRDLVIAGALVVVAALGIGAIAFLPGLFTDDAPAVLKPKTERIAYVPKVEEPKKPDPIKLAPQEKKRPTPAEKKPMPKEIEEPRVVLEPKKVAPKDNEPKNTDPIEPKKTPVDAKVDKIIVVDDSLIKLNDPDGEYHVKTLHGGIKVEIIGRIKTLKIAGLNEHSVLKLSDLTADEIQFTGNVNGESRVVVGKTRSLTIRDVNDKSEIDASASAASAIVVQGAINSGSAVKLQAQAGSIEFRGEINDRARIEVAIPDGKAAFKGINGNARLTVLARDAEFASPINGPQTELAVTLTHGGSLKVRQIHGGVKLEYRKAAAGDPALRLEFRDVDARAQFRELPALKK
jgi:hypothetical protein